MVNKPKSEYAKAGVDYTVMEPFKMAMIEAGRKTLKFPNKRCVYINEDATHAHGAVFEYRGSEAHIWCKTQEDLGNKNWIAEWMYERTGKSYYENIAIDTALIVVNDVIAPAKRLITGKKLSAGDVIIGASSSGLHANGISLVIQKALELPEQ